MKIAIGSDHAGFKLKDLIIKYLQDQKVEVKDFGTSSEESCDYPDFAFPVAEAVSHKKADRGILICGSGVGMVVAANKVKGIRAVNAYDEYTARQSREHGDCNVLCLAGRKLKEDQALKIVDIWLHTSFSGDERHLRRISKIAKREG
ncbi:ribose 5-phosphate isomerase B [Candidatus Saganbacteria bacterium]|nr:ribose 5-phosphate isomerase B [Candidatus Saganbacteria bacterium]